MPLLKGSLLALLSGLLYGGLGYFGVTLITQGMSMTGMLFWRFVISALLLSFLLSPLKKSYQFPSLKGILLSAAFYSGCIFYFLSCLEIGTGLAMVVFFTFPVMVACLQWGIHGVSLPRVYVPLFGLILYGLWLIADISHAEMSLWGIFLSLLSGFSYAAYIVLGQRYATTVDPVLWSCLVSLFTAVPFLCLSFFNGDSLAIPLKSDVLMNLFGLGLIATALPIWLFFRSLEWIHPTLASIMTVSEPLMTLFIAGFVLEETLSGRQEIGVLITIASVIMVKAYEFYNYNKVPTT